MKCPNCGYCKQTEKKGRKKFWGLKIKTPLTPWSPGSGWEEIRKHLTSEPIMEIKNVQNI